MGKKEYVAPKIEIIKCSSDEAFLAASMPRIPIIEDPDDPDNPIYADPDEDVFSKRHDIWDNDWLDDEKK
ncbi:hypothetical protein E5358_01295 [Palleniella muris]|uniref:Uncharacterized protein n=1 Tax=Palleniella muris TaxID=3038145 RepID=A0AC61QTP7_9BACT|nr:hypothetical protein [Palleniella muris]TGX83843.1 hypothetical protein E5358_01295 [Palleniella muris]